MTPITKQIEAIEERFEKFFIELTDERKWINGKPVVNGVMYVTVFNGIQDFYRQEILNLLSELRERVEGIPNYEMSPVKKKKVALSDVLSILDGEGE